MYQVLCERWQRWQRSARGGDRNNAEQHTVSKPKLIVPTNLQMETVGLVMLSQLNGQAMEQFDGGSELEKLKLEVGAGPRQMSRQWACI